MIQRKYLYYCQNKIQRLARTLKSIRTHQPLWVVRPKSTRLRTKRITSITSPIQPWSLLLFLLPPILLRAWLQHSGRSPPRDCSHIWVGNPQHCLEYVDRPNDKTMNLNTTTWTAFEFDARICNAQTRWTHRTEEVWDWTQPVYQQEKRRVSLRRKTQTCKLMFHYNVERIVM